MHDDVLDSDGSGGRGLHFRAGRSEFFTAGTFTRCALGDVLFDLRDHFDGTACDAGDPAEFPDRNRFALRPVVELDRRGPGSCDCLRWCYVDAEARGCFLHRGSGGWSDSMFLMSGSFRASGFAFAHGEFESRSWGRVGGGRSDSRNPELSHHVARPDFVMF